jgi:hypothetical protein
VISFFVLLKTRSHSVGIAGIARVSKAQRCSETQIGPWRPINKRSEKVGKVRKNEGLGAPSTNLLWLRLHSIWPRRKPRGLCRLGLGKKPVEPGPQVRAHGPCVGITAVVPMNKAPLGYYDMGLDDYPDGSKAEDQQNTSIVRHKIFPSPFQLRSPT